MLTEKEDKRIAKIETRLDHLEKQGGAFDNYMLGIKDGREALKNATYTPDQIIELCYLTRDDLDGEIKDVVDGFVEEGLPDAKCRSFSDNMVLLLKIKKKQDEFIVQLFKELDK